MEQNEKYEKNIYSAYEYKYLLSFTFYTTASKIGKIVYANCAFMLAIFGR